MQFSKPIDRRCGKTFFLNFHDFSSVFETGVNSAILPDKEEGVHAVCTVCDRLEEEFLLHNFSQLHVVGVLENDDAGVAFVIERKIVIDALQSTHRDSNRLPNITQAMDIARSP